MYIPLFNKTNYTLLSSLLKIDDIISYAKNNNLDSISIVDTNMYGTMEFIKKCEKNEIKPIIGLELILDGYNIVVIAKNYDGYKELIKLSTSQNENKLTNEILNKYNKNLIAVVPYLYRNNFEDINKIYEDIYLGFSNKKEEQEALVITNNIVFFQENLYLENKDSEILPYLYKIRDGKTISDEDKYDIDNHSLIISNIEELSNKTGINNTNVIADKCEIVFPKPKLLLPIYECDNASNYLFELCKAGLNKRLNKTIPEDYRLRLSHELKVIDEMGFSNYFLVVYDFIKYAKKHGILVGPGRGSGAGSLVAYSLGITDIDPLEYDLLFERFLNPERKTMPDIDTDFPDNRRDEVIHYVEEKYGKRRVCGIVTFGTLSAKQVLRDVGRVLNIPTYKVDSICKLIPGVTKEKLKDFYEKNNTFKARIDSDISLSNLYKIALKIEGFPRHTSAHAAGIIMSQIDLDEVIPLTIGNDMYLSSYSMEYLEDLGLLKMDFLGIKNLTIIDNIIKNIKEMYNEDIDFSKIPLDDKDTLHMFEEANTSGIFQFESTGMRNFLRRLRPNTFEDIFAAIALFRPGAAINIDSYIKRRHNEEKVTYLDPSLEKITKNTYGILIYQEQIMQLANVYAGYSLGEADILRRAMSKKKVDLLKQEEEKFINKSIEKGHTKEQAEKIFNLVLNFAGYGFNRSHSVAYSLVAYKMAYLKCHYPTIFFQEILTNIIGSESKTHEYIMEAKANGIEVLKPTINESDSRYIIKDNKLVYPISNIKSIGSVVSEQIKTARKDSKFNDIYDCISRLYLNGVGKKSMETLILADTFKEFGYNRATLIYNLDSLFNYAELTKDIDPSLIIKPEIEYQKDYSNEVLLEKEKDVFGFYLSQHPTTNYRKDNKYCITLNNVSKYLNKTVDTLILVDKIKVINTKKGDKMAFITGSDETSTMEYTLFPKVFNNYPDIERGNLLKIRGNVERRLDQIQIIVDKIKNLKEDNNDKENN
ncbi:MAG: DNA polymerase III subunit alpha [Bacilli bacterium]|nr:DNA polymerase III subunit alpha [Bacilli bacterium]